MNHKSLTNLHFLFVFTCLFPGLTHADVGVVSPDGYGVLCYLDGGSVVIQPCGVRYPLEFSKDCSKDPTRVFKRMELSNFTREMRLLLSSRIKMKYEECQKIPDDLKDLTTQCE